MESNFSNRDFEQFVKQNADQYRMFPSEKVWKGVNSAIAHPQKMVWFLAWRFSLTIRGCGYLGYD